MTVYFVDTTVFCNLLAVPGRSQHEGETKTELKAKQEENAPLILPVAAIVETGNFIAQVADGTLRRLTAERFKGVLELVCTDRAPWQLHQFSWGSDLLQSFIAGGDTGMNLVEHAVNKLGGGDLSILVERQVYRNRTGIRDVQVWTRDAGLRAHN